jgi:hypothetical protein
MVYLVGIDDTDNLVSRGTGFIGRTMGEEINASGLGVCGGVSRHQLLFDPRVPYTSHNSSLCLEIETSKPDEVWDLMVEYLIRSCAEGSDCGLCMVELDRMPQSIIKWGLKAKKDLVKQVDAFKLAKKENVRLIGLTGNHDGVIGSMAAVGLRASGNDGRFVSLKGVDVRTINGVKNLQQIQELVQLHQIMTVDGVLLDEKIPISLDGWMRPVHRKGLITLIVNKIDDNEECNYQLAAKEYIKSVSD